MLRVRRTPSSTAGLALAPGSAPWDWLTAKTPSAAAPGPVAKTRYMDVCLQLHMPMHCRGPGNEFGCLCPYFQAPLAMLD